MLNPVHLMIAGGPKLCYNFCRFVWAETYYLWRWWMEQDNEKRHQVRELINTGRLEIVGGGFTMNDEATTNYLSVIDQMTLGFK